MPSSPATTALASVCPEGWQVLPLADVAYFQEGPGILAKDFRDSGVPLLRLKGVEGDYVTLDGCNYLDPEMVARKWNHFRVDVGDLLISTSASLGRVSVVTNESTGGVPYTGLIRFRPKDPRLLAGYLKVFLGSAAFVEQAESMASGSVIRHFGPSHIRQMAILLPPLDEQLQIGQLASRLDERLRLLRQTNATLESIAQALFKSWFIDFDPVRAKAEGREPEGMDAATAALFPAEFEESALGLIPKGWHAGCVAELAALNVASWSARRAPNEVLYVDLASVKANVFEPPQRLLFADAPSRARRELRSGDTLVGTVRPGNRSFGFIADAEPGLTGSTGFAVLSPLAPDAASFVYLCTTRDENIERLAALADGGAYPAIQPDMVQATACVLPSVSVLNAFHDVTSPLLQGIAGNTRRSRMLGEIRDALLPRLISGKLRLPEAQDRVEDAIA